jgi:hypothetical protein
MQYFCLYGTKETQYAFKGKWGEKFNFGNFGKLHIIIHACKSMQFFNVHVYRCR